MTADIIHAAASAAQRLRSNGQTGSNARMDSQRRVPEVGFWEAYAERRWDSAQTIASRTCLPNRSLQGSNRSRAASGAVSSVHRNAHRERTWIR